MKICWLGWTGWCMNEVSSGLIQFDPNILYYIIGQGVIPEPDEYKLFGVRKNEKIYTGRDILIQDLQEFDVIIFDSYSFSIKGCPDRITSLISDTNDIDPFK